jgi:hypothetical protein
MERTINGYTVSNFEKLMWADFKELHVDPRLKDIEFD